MTQKTDDEILKEKKLFIEKQFQKMAKGISRVVKTEEDNIIIPDFYLRNLIRDALSISWEKAIALADERAKAEFEKIIDDFFDEDNLYFRSDNGVFISCNKTLAEKIKQKLREEKE